MVKKQIFKISIDYENTKMSYLCKFKDASYEKISFFNFIGSIDRIIVNEAKVIILDIGNTLNYCCCMNRPAIKLSLNIGFIIVIRPISMIYIII